jgi:hypothetical protein
MSCLIPPPVRRQARSRHAAIAAAACAVACLAPATASAVTYGEQVDRGEGLAGTTAIETLASEYGGPGLPSPSASTIGITDDGKWAVFNYSTDYAHTQIYARDTAAGHTNLLVSDARGSGIDAAGKWLSFTTASRLDPADTNDLDDVYLEDLTTAKFTLVSRATATGPAIGSTAGGVSRDGTAAVFGSGGKTYRRDLATGAVTTLGPTELVNGPYLYRDAATTFRISADGRAALPAAATDPEGAVDRAESVQVVSGGKTTTLTAPAGTTFGGRRLSGDGKKLVAVVSPKDVASPVAGTPGVRVIDVATGVGTTFPFTPSLAIQGAELSDVSTNGSDALLALTYARGAARINAEARVDLTTGAITQVGGDLASRAPRLLSPNRKFGLTAADSHVWAVPITGTLPVAQEAPSPLAYLRYELGCKGNDLFTSLPRPAVEFSPTAGSKPSVYSSTPTAGLGWGTLATSIVVNAYSKGSGALFSSATLTASKNTLRLQGVFGNSLIKATARFADGRTASDSVSIPKYDPVNCYFYLS